MPLIIEVDVRDGSKRHLLSSSPGRRGLKRESRDEGIYLTLGPILAETLKAQAEVSQSEGKREERECSLQFP